ncbi:Gfo/Idh/MocA family oxidoreductase [Salinarchaeum chitinilyticum]
MQIGTGGQGEHWCRETLPPNVADGTIEVVAAVDQDEAALTNAVDALDLEPERCFTDAAEALAAVDADAVSLVVPPSAREPLIDLAVEHDLDVLTEKPLADTMEDAVRFVRTVEDAGLKMGVTMSHRYRRDVTSLRRTVQAGDAGDVDNVYSRYAVNARSYGSWATPRLYDLKEHPLLVDGAVHHLDLLADLAGDRADTVYCHAWNPEHSDFAAEPNANVQLVMENGTSVVYEGQNTNAAMLNGWGDEHVRVDGTDATLVLDGHELRAFPYDSEAEGCIGNERFEDGDPVDLDEQAKWSNAWLVEQFADWCAGGEPMETNARANLQAMALVFAAVESADTGEVVEVQRVLEDAKTAADEAGA